MRFRSRKREAQYRERRGLVAELLAERAVCERCGMNPSTDVHEVVRRSQWRDGILDRANLRCLCRGCHHFITVHPRVAMEEGWSAPSWQRDRYTTSWDGAPE